MGQALYRKYRPRSLKDVAGQEHITHTLEQALKTGRISHAYLFTGPRGVGKTSIARIMAHEINGLKYSENSSHIDIIEIDAASNRRIDEIRELRERVYVAPAEAKYKVYIIDEVHMLTREAFNALLKTLEEPPSHVIFILATTEVHKLPETIISRTQRFGFKPINNQAIQGKLAEICKKEGMKISDGALKLLAEHGQGSLRDSESMLDQARSLGVDINEDTVINILGLPPQSELDKLLKATLNSSDIKSTVSILENLYLQGYQADTIAKQLNDILRDGLITTKIENESKVLSLMSDLIDIPSSSNPERLLEIVLLKAQPKDLNSPIVTTSGMVEGSPETEAENINGIDTDKDKKPAATKKDTNSGKDQPQYSRIDKELWGKVLASLKQKHSTLYGIARMAVPYFSQQDKLDLFFAFDLHRKRVNEAANRLLLSEVIKELTGKDVVIECHFDKDIKTPKPEEVMPVESNKPDSLSAISNIFNGAELLES